MFPKKLNKSEKEELCSLVVEYMGLKVYFYSSEMVVWDRDQRAHI